MPGLHKLMMQAVLEHDRYMARQAYQDGFVMGFGAAMLVTLIFLTAYELWYKK